MEIINLNLIPGKAWPVAHATQFDKGREFRANLFEGSQVYTLAGDETVDAIIKKPDGNQVTEALVNTADTYVIVTTTEQMTAVAGPSLGEIRITKGDTVIGSLKFILECEQSADTGIASDSAIHNLEAQVNQMVEDAVAEQYDSNNVLFDTAPTAGHGVPYAVTSGGLWSWMRDLPLRAYPTASGAIATFDTSLALPLQDCTIAINAVQEEGTPTPSSPKAITGFTGANIVDNGINQWDEIAEVGSINTSTGANEYSVNRIRSKNYIQCLPNTEYSFAFPSSSHAPTGDIRIFFYDTEKNYIGYENWKTVGNTFTTPSNTFYLRFYTNGTYGENYQHDISINYPASSGTTYHAYNGTTTPITWQDEAGTVYGGSLDVTSGVLTVTHKKVKISDTVQNDWSYFSVTQGSLFRYVFADMVSTISGGIVNALSDSYATVAQVSRTDNTISGSPNTKNVDIVDNRYTTIADFYTNNPDIVLVYELATPVIYQLTPTQISSIVGTNNIFTDTNGDTSVMYACSLKDYIDSQ